MNVQEAYLRFLTKVNRNLSSNNIVASKDRFVLLYNEEQIRFLDYCLDFRNDEDIIDVEDFVADCYRQYSTVKPNDWFEVSSILSQTNVVGLSLFEIKNFDHIIIIDANNDLL